MRYIFYSVYVTFLTCVVLFDWNSNFNQLILLLTSLLFIQNVFEIFLLRKSNFGYLLLNPILIASILNFLLGLGGFSNFLLFTDNEFFRRFPRFMNSSLDYYYIKTMYLVCWASIAMWFGYMSRMGDFFFNVYMSTFKMKRFFNGRINILVVIIVFIVGFSSIYVLFRNGLFGSFVDLSKTTMAGNTSFAYSQARVLRGLPMLTLLLTSILYFRNRKNPICIILFFSTLLLQIFISIFSGSRSPIVFTMLVVFFSYYFIYHRISKVLVFSLFASLLIAFTVSMEFKHFVQSLNNDNFTLTKTLSGYKDFKRNNVEYKKSLNNSFLRNFAIRSNQVNQAVGAVKYTDEGRLNNQSPNFGLEFAKVPFRVFIPSFITKEPNISWGNWFRIDVMGFSKKIRSNMAFSPLGFLYFTGGSFVVISGFFIYGILLKFTCRFLEFGQFGFISYLLIFGTIVFFKTNIPGMLITFIRSLFMPILIYLLLKKK